MKLMMLPKKQITLVKLIMFPKKQITLDEVDDFS